VIAVDVERPPEVTVAVVISWTGAYWRLRYLKPCEFCGRKHQHGGGDAPDGPHLGEDTWGSHCGAGHKPAGPYCEPDHRYGRTRCYLRHQHMVRLVPATPLELELAGLA
jgi:hypothetical protein